MGPIVAGHADVDGWLKPTAAKMFVFPQQAVGGHDAVESGTPELSVHGVQYITLEASLSQLPKGQAVDFSCGSAGRGLQLWLGWVK